MRILLTADPELPVPPKLYGGIERVIDVLIRGLRDRDHTVGLIAHRDSSSPANQLFHWPGLRSQQKLDAMRNTAALRSAVQRFQPDLVHSFSRVLYLLPLFLTSLPKVMSYQRRPSRRSVKWGAKLGRESLIFTGCSEYICREGRTAGGVWHAIHNCVEIEKYTFQPEVAPEAPLVFLSRVEQIKGAHTAIDIARRTGRRLLIAGNHSAGEQEESYWQEMIRPHLGKNGIEYIGPVDDEQKNDLLGQAAALVVPIEWDEPFGIVFAEALACGTPVISCPRGALPEIVRQGVDGFLITDVDDACKAVDRISEINRAGCRQRAEDRFSSAVAASAYEHLYHMLVSDSGQ